MSMDIRSFFNTISKKTGTSPKPSNEKNPNKKRQKSHDSSNDNIIPKTPDVAKKNKKTKIESQVKRRRITVVSDSDSDSETSKIKPKPETKNKSNKSAQESKTTKETSKSVSKGKLLIGTVKEMRKETSEYQPKKTVNLFDVFGNEPIKQTKVDKPIPNTEFNIHDDDEFEKTLLELDEDEFIKKAEMIVMAQENDRKINSEIDSKCQKRDCQMTGKSNEISKKTSTYIKSENKQKVLSEKIQKVVASSESESEKKTKTQKPKISPFKVKDSPQTSTPDSLDYKSNKTPSHKRKFSESEDSGMDPDQERHEKKRYSAILYQKYLNRGGPINPGSKWTPKGKEDCLKCLSFVVTGILESLTREEAENLIIEHGGRCTKSLSGKINYLVLGQDAGPSKVEKARTFNTKILTEDELLDLICMKSGIKNKNVSSDIKANGDGKIEFKIDESKIEKNNDIKEIIPSKAKSGLNLAKLRNENIDDSFKVNNVKKIKIKQETNDDVEIPSTTVKNESQIKSNNFYNSKKPKLESLSTSKMLPKFEKVSKPPAENQLAWVDKYRPTQMKQIIGQQGDQSNARKLMVWLQNWYKNQNGKNKHAKPSPWAKNYDGAFYKAALLSGPPGVGKTTTATVVCKELGFDVVEFNASDTRNKRMIHEEISQLLKTNSLAGYFTDGSAPTNKHVLLMDEVDGMSGNEDRGGMQELISLIKNSNIPIVCMCNDRQHPKIRSLSSYCFDLRYPKPRLEQIRGSMMSICFKENIEISPEALNQVIIGSGMDVRQTLNHLSMWSAKGNTLSKETAEKEAKTAQKDTKIGPWEVIKKVFSEEDHKQMSLDDKYRLFFYDYSIGPLFVQENYLQVMPHCPKDEILKRVAYAADSISLGDLVDAKIRSNQSWGLLETQALYSSVVPGECMEGHVAGQINFPGWLGKNSKRNKFQRMLSELQAHMRTSISGSKTAVNLDYLTYIRDAIVTPLAKEGVEGIPKALTVMKEYHLLREDLTNITELARWPRSKDVFSCIDSKVKAAFTRAYNKDSVMLPYSIAAVPIKKRRGGASQEDEEMMEVEDNGDSSEEDNDNIDNDFNIKAKKQPAKAAKADGKITNKGKETKGSKAPSKQKGKRSK